MNFGRASRTLPAVILAASLVAFPGRAGVLAADQLVPGKKLVIKNPPSGPAANKVVHLGKDASITVGAAGGLGDPQCTGASGGGTSFLYIAASGGAGGATIPLPCNLWSTNAANTLYTNGQTRPIFAGAALADGWWSSSTTWC